MSATAHGHARPPHPRGTAGGRSSASPRDVRRGRSARGGRRAAVIPTALLLIGSLYCLLPVVWVFMAASKSPAELFSTFSFAPGSGLVGNLQELATFGQGLFWSWSAHSLLYAGVGALLSTLVSTMIGYALAKFDFPGRQVIFYAVLAGVLIPGITLAIPQYLLLADLGLAGGPLSVLLPSIISPFGIYLSRVYAASAIPQDILEAARIDGASEAGIFARVVLPLMVLGMVTVFLLQFVGIWNNFLLPYVMLAQQREFPLTVGLYTLLVQGSGTSALYSLAITGAAVSVIPLVALVLFLQRYWKLDLLSGGLKG